MVGKYTKQCYVFINAYIDNNGLYSFIGIIIPIFQPKINAEGGGGMRKRWGQRELGRELFIFSALFFTKEKNDAIIKYYLSLRYL